MLPVLAEIVRNDFVEGHHRGAVVALGPDGGTEYAAGEVTAPFLPRSCNKPLQAIGMVESGLDLPPDLMALACASHSGEAFHVAGVRRILGSAGLEESALQTPPDYPLDDVVREDHLRAGGVKEPVLMNCSGKHAAMLATCVVNDWDTATYLAPDHPLQRRIHAGFEAATGEVVAHAAVDGCGAPLLSTSLTGLARAFAGLATATDGAGHRIAEAIRAHPEYVSGTHRPELLLLRAVPGMIGKMGAESCYVGAFPDGRAVALKIDDGAMRAWPVVLAALLERLGWDTGTGVDTPAVRRLGEHPLHGGTAVVGAIRATLP
ncbi:MAG: asparaginase [Marmoricola sp.]